MNTAPLTRTAPSPYRESGEHGIDAGAGAQRLAPGSVVAGRYVIRGELGRGGFAVVYDAEHLGLGRTLAVKVVHLDDDMPVELLARARREARNAALVRHPNILEVFDTGGLDDGSPFLVMERIEGETLSKRIERSGLTIPAIVETGKQLLLALEALAAHSIIHRDVKSENVMLHDGGDGRLVVKLVDFGISKRITPDSPASLTRDGCLVGTPCYMSPEQVRGESIDSRTDIYGAGAVLYEALAGRPPHDHAGVPEVMLATLNDPVPAIRSLRADCPEELERIVLKALAKAPEDRYPSATAMRVALEQVAATHALPTASKAWRAPQPGVGANTPAEQGGRVWKAAGVLHALTAQPLRVRMLAASVLVVMVALAAAAVTRARRGAATAALQSVARPVDNAETLPVRGMEPVRQLTPAPVAAPASRLENGQAVAPVTPRPRQRVRRNAATPVPVTAPVRRPAQPAASVAPSSDTKHLINSAIAAYATGQYDASESFYRKALVRDRGNVDALRGLGVMALHRGSPAEARIFFERYLQRAPNAKDSDAIRARVAALRRD
jgi:tetratricopeptide (TPR) repeat protein